MKITPGENMTQPYILILKGSPREKGNSSTLAEQAAAGARQAGAEVACFDLHKLDIHTCDACDICQGVSEGECIIQDDMQMLYPKLRQADAILVASPVYWFTVSAQAKLCIDRWYALESPRGNELAHKKFGLILTYGDIDPYTSGAINAIRTFQDMIRYINGNLVEIVYGSLSKVGDAQKQPELMAQAFKLGQKLAVVN
jgi:multimeric flavodoxin WrbA